ncbi:CDK5 regulatory subunit-associated protein 2-like [Symsagittifera roscoffensis]|uniref:CDK5 regulatory subunit-associated protein 2-like n=1 Tax=Symsagittifera roscoffensis TaxID=84072 RepID=UPI00307B1EBF
MSDKCREFLKEKIKTLSGECEEKKGMVEVLTRVDGELRGEIAEREKEVKELRPLCARKEALLSEAEEFVKKGTKRVEELKELIKTNSAEIEKMRGMEESALRSTLHAQDTTEKLKATLKHKDTNEYIPIVQKRSRLEKTLNEVELKSQRAEERCVSLQEDVHAIRGQISILNHAVLKMEVESKSKDERIAQLVKEIESKRTERYENEQQIETLKGRVAELYQGMEQLELEKERFDLSFL